MDCGKLIIIDWDDTILSTTHLNSLGYRASRKFSIDSKMRDSLERLEKTAIELIKLAKTCGTVCIVTNSEEGWVDLSCKLFVPNLRDHIKDIDIISARTKYEKVYPMKPSLWKVAAMQDCVNKWFRSPDVITDFISFGDSFGDRHAAHIVGKDLAISTTKSVKFSDSPTTEQLAHQQELVLHTFPHLCTHPKDLDLMLTITLKA